MKCRKRLYHLTQLKRANIGLKELLQFYKSCIRPVFSGGARPQNFFFLGGEGHLRGKLIFWGGGQDIIFKKVLLFAHAVVTGLSPPPSGDSPPAGDSPP